MGSSPPEQNEVLFEKTEDGILVITLNKPKRKNALTTPMYLAVTKALTEANADPSIKLVVYTGKGDYFCSGNDLGNFSEVSDEDVPKMAQLGQQMFKNYITAIINLKKPLIILLNGSAVGVGVTILGLCDIAFSTDKAVFNTPFTVLGQTPEGCSSYTFPRIMGYTKASEMLYFNAKITAREAEANGLITKVFPDDVFQIEVWKKIKEMAQLQTNTLVYTKELVRGRQREKLLAINTEECDRLLERWLSEDFANAILDYFMKRGKL